MFMDNEALVDFTAGWISGAGSVTLTQPLDTTLTRLQARTTEQPQLVTSSRVHHHQSIFLGHKIFRHTYFTFPTLNLLKEHRVVLSLWAGNSALVSAIPFQNALMMAGYGYGKRVCEVYYPESVLFGVFIGGCTGGIIQSFIMSPVELIKVSQQVAGQSLSKATSTVTTGFLSRQIAWRGLEATLLRDGLPHGVWFASYEMMKQYLNTLEIEGTKQDKYFNPLLSGAFAAFTAWGVGYPFDIIKTRIQSPGGQNKTVIVAAKEIMKESNGRLSGLYRGFTLKLAKAIPSSAINFFLYETVTEAFRKKLS